jgi:hypothetical protein
MTHDWRDFWHDTRHRANKTIFWRDYAGIVPKSVARLWPAAAPFIGFEDKIPLHFRPRFPA